MARKFLIKRSGDRALSFEGRLIAKAGAQGDYGEAKERWHTLALYHTETGKFVASVEYHATWEGEEEWFEAFVSDMPEKLIEQLQEYDPFSCIFGLPGYSAVQITQRTAASGRSNTLRQRTGRNPRRRA